MRARGDERFIGSGGTADGRHAAHVTAMDGPRLQTPKGRNGGGLHRVCMVRRRRSCAARAPWQCWSAPTTAASPRWWSHDRHIHRRSPHGRGSRKRDGAGLAARAAPVLGALHTVAAAGCECLAHAANRHAGLPESLAPVMVRLWDAVKAARSGFASGDRCLTGVGLIYEPGSCTRPCWCAACGALDRFWARLGRSWGGVGWS